MMTERTMEPIFWTKSDHPDSRRFLEQALDIAITEGRYTTITLFRSRVLGGEILGYTSGERMNVTFRIIFAGGSSQVMTRGYVGISEVIVTDRLVADVEDGTLPTPAAAPATSAVATLIREARGRRGLTQADLAAAASVSPSYISHLEAGREVATHPATIDRMAAALGIDPDALYAAAGRIPDDLVQRLAADPDAVRRVREALET